MLRRTLEYHDAARNEHKFWVGAVEGAMFTTQSGHIGKKAKDSSQSFDSESKAVDALNSRCQVLIEKGYVDSEGAAPSPGKPPSAFRYNLSWKLPSLAEPVSKAMFDAVLSRLVAITAACGAGRWECGVSDGDGGPTLSLTDTHSQHAVQFGFMPVGLAQSLSDQDRAVHAARGINGFLSPQGFGEDGGVLSTDGLWIDFAAKVMLLLFRHEGAGIEVWCDFGDKYTDGRMILPHADHRSKLVWASEWGNLLDVLAEHDLLAPGDQTTIALRKMARNETRRIWR